jgi:hypothetical protein
MCVVVVKATFLHRAIQTETLQDFPTASLTFSYALFLYYPLLLLVAGLSLSLSLRPSFSAIKHGLFPLLVIRGGVAIP